MIYDGRNTAMAKCYNSIKHLVKKIPLISSTRKTNGATLPLNPKEWSHRSRADLCLYREPSEASGVMQF